MTGMRRRQGLRLQAASSGLLLTSDSLHFPATTRNVTRILRITMSALAYARPRDRQLVQDKVLVLLLRLSKRPELSLNL
jgi:hypothetical protein